jgi:hypothetical protein
MNAQPVIIMVGLPESGKSTYLGALYHALGRPGDDGLRLARAPEDREYLLELERRWLALTPLERSRHHGAKDVQIPILTADGAELVLAIPDVVGEDYLDAWLHGGWREGLLDWLNRANGILLFVRADNVQEATLISVDTVTDSPNKKSDRWDPNTTPTQAMLCDLLEQIAEARAGTLPPIAVVVAAWDEAAQVNLPPPAWLNWRTPLLDQRLRANEAEVPFKVFGVSAQGGNLHDEAVRQSLASHIEDRPLPKNGSPLTAPLKWLLERNRD